MRDRIRRVVRMCAVAFYLLLHAGTANAEQRLAFVVGIDQYSNFGPDAQLRRAVADADSIAGSLGRLGFTVTLLARNETVTQDLFLRTFAAFSQSIRPGDTVLFYFAGHGVGLNGVNYLVPADVPNLADADEYMFRAHALAESDIRNRIQERGAAITILMLDACRNNPFRSSDRAISYARGLAPIAPTNGVLTIYAAGYGQTALDRLSDEGDPSPNSVFTRVVLGELEKPGTNLIDFSEDVRERVATLARSVGHDQVPAVDNQLLGGRSLFLAPPVPVAAAPPPAPDDVLWSYLKSGNDASALRRFMADYPTSQHRHDAEAALAALEQPVAAPSQPAVETPVAADTAAWAHVASSAFSADLRAFMERYPDSPLKPRAQARMSELDDALWEKTRAEDPAALRHYLALFWDGRHRQDAETWLADLEVPKDAPVMPPPLAGQASRPQIEPAQGDVAEWARISSTGFAADVRDFLDRYPQSALRPQAEAKLAALDEALWAQTPLDDIAALRHYLAIFPEGQHRMLSGSRLTILEAPQPAAQEPHAPEAVAPPDAALPAVVPSQVQTDDMARTKPRTHERRQSSLPPAKPSPATGTPPAVRLHRAGRASPKNEDHRQSSASAAGAIRAPRIKAASEPPGCFEAGGERFCASGAAVPTPAVARAPRIKAAPQPKGCFEAGGERFCP